MSWTGLNGSTASELPLTPFVAALLAPSGAAISDTESFGERTDWIATATARFGLASRNWLFYGKGGAAFDRNTYTLSHQTIFQGPPPALPVVEANFSSTASDVRVGWTLGAGMEWAFARSWSAKLEYDFMDFGSKPVSCKRDRRDKLDASLLCSPLLTPLCRMCRRRFPR